MAVEDEYLSRRERKSRRTRREIVRAATDLVLADGYERATIARIAERADLATRTVTTHFPTKDAIFFEGFEDAIDRAERHLRDGRGDAVDRLRAWIGEMTLLAEDDPGDLEVQRLRAHAIAVDPDLRALRVHHFDRGHDAIARAVAADTGEPPDGVGPQMVAASAVALLGVVERLSSVQSPETWPELERGFGILRATMNALKR